MRFSSTLRRVPDKFLTVPRCAKVYHPLMVFGKYTRSTPAEISPKTKVNMSKK